MGESGIKGPKVNPLKESMLDYFSNKIAEGLSAS